jgi:hypothetical protein
VLIVNAPPTLLLAVEPKRCSTPPLACPIFNAPVTAKEAPPVKSWVPSPLVTLRLPPVLVLAASSV